MNFFDFKNIIFDMDGTILDSMHIWDEVTINFMGSIGHPVTKEYLAEIGTKSISAATRYTVEKFALDMKPHDLAKRILDEAAHHYYNTLSLKPFAKEFIEKMHSRGVKMCIATASDRYLAQGAFTRLKVIDYFEFILTNDDVGVSKTEPDIYLRAAEMLNANVADVTVFEDALHCVKTAKNAGFKVVAVNDLSTEAHKLEIQKIADIYIHSYEELLKY